MAKKRQTVGQRIKAARLAEKLTQVELAERLGVGQSWVSEVESDIKPQFAQACQLLPALARAIGVDVGDFLG